MLRNSDGSVPSTSDSIPETWTWQRTHWGKLGFQFWGGGGGAAGEMVNRGRGVWARSSIDRVIVSKQLKAPNGGVFNGHFYFCTECKAKT